MAKKVIYITKNYCLSKCKLLKNNAVDLDTCHGCCIGTLFDSTHFIRIDLGFAQLSIFDFGVDSNG